MKSTTNQTLRGRLALVALIASALFPCAANGADRPGAELRVATYNLRFASDTGPNAWPERRALVAEVIHSIQPDIVGTQEGLLQQLRDVAADLPEYDWIGQGRDGGTDGEFMAIFYRKEKVLPLATNHFWLSDTPEIPASITWGNSNRRMVTCVKFREQQSGTEFHLFNTHFDHEIQTAREKSAALVRARIAQLTNNLPVILTGDFNADAGRNRAFRILTEDGFLTDSWTESTVRWNEGVGTFNGFREVTRDGARIDWILIRGGVSVRSAEIVTLRPRGRWASDHFPVVTHLVIRNRQ